jgi:hypothetical protein
MFGNQWLALGVILIGVGVFLMGVAAVGKWLAATHPDPVPAKPEPNKAPEPAPLAPADELTPEVFAIIAAAVAVTFGNKARIAGIKTAAFPSVETLMQQWSLEGRRQIYSSHKVR